MKFSSRIMRPVRAVMMVMVLGTIGMSIPMIYAHADKGDLTPVGTKKAGATRLVSITMGKGEIVDVKGEIADVLVANPSIADVVALQSSKLYIVGSKMGDTNLMVLDAEGNEIQRFDIHVKVDEAALQAYLNTSFPGEKIKVQALNMRVMLSGEVSTPDVASRAAQIVSGYMSQVMQKEGSTDQLIVNLLRVRGEQQVMLKVRILEVNKTLLKELGVETSLQENGTGLGSDNLNGSIASAANTGLTTAPFGLGTLVFDDGNFGPAQILLKALQRDNMVRTLAEPNLTAISGQEAGFLAGGEFPVPTGRDNSGNILIQFRAFGVSLNFKPTVMSENRISLQLKTEVSSIARENAVTLASLSIPGLNIRRASTTVEVPSGGGLMIGGLLQSQTVQGMAGLPGVIDVPVLGDLIKSRSFNRQESELVVLITAYLVKPYAEKSATIVAPPAAPTMPVITPINQPMNVQPVPTMPALRSGKVDVAPMDPVANVTADPNDPLQNSFADNIRRIYGRKAPAELNEPGRYGYLMD